MGDKNSFKKSLENAMPFIAIGILIMLILVGILLYREQNLKQEISENCGWGEDDYYCYCEKSDAMKVKNRIGEGRLSSLNVDKWEIENASLDR